MEPETQQIPDRETISPATPKALTELDKALEELVAARAQCDVTAIDAANQKIASVRARIAEKRTELANLGSERLHLIEVVEQAKLRFLRSERVLEDHDHRIERIREELRLMGGKPQAKPDM